MTGTDDSSRCGARRIPARKPGFGLAPVLALQLGLALAASPDALAQSAVQPRPVETQPLAPPPTAMPSPTIPAPGVQGATPQAAVPSTAPASAPAAAGASGDIVDFFAVKSFEFETFRDEANRFNLSLRVDDAGRVALSSLLVSVKKRGATEEISIDDAKSVAYDPATQTLSLAFNRNEAGLASLTGKLSAVEREFHHVRRLTGQASFEAVRASQGVAAQPARTEPVVMTGSVSRIRNKPDCFVDLYTGANLSVITLKGRYAGDKTEWAAPVAAREGWTLLRRRIDYLKGEDEFDVSVPPGLELRAFQAIVGLPEATCLSVGGDEGDSVDGQRIIDIPAGRLMSDRAAGTQVAPDKLRDVLGTIRVENRVLQATLDDTPARQPMVFALTGPARAFGVAQDADKPLRVRLSVEIGLSPGKRGDIAEALRVTRKDVARSTSGGVFETVKVATGTADDVSSSLDEWQGKYIEALAKALGGTLN